MTTVPYTFGDESSPIPLSQLDANFAITPNFANTAGNVTNAVQANITAVGTLTSLSVLGNIRSANVNTTGQFSSVGNVVAGNIITGGVVTAIGAVTGSTFNTAGNVTAGGQVSATGNVIAANVITAGFVTATGNVTGANILTGGLVSATGNISALGIISATGNVVTAGFFVGNFLGNITGNITGAPGSTGQVLFNTAGNVDAVGGLTYDKGSNVLTVLGVVSAQGNVISNSNLSVTGNASIGGALTVGGGAQISGVVTGPTAPTGTANNQLATTVFVSNQINQYANSVAITGGTITVTSVVANASVTANVIQANVANVGAWTIKEIGTALYFQRGNANIAKLDSAGNFTCIGNVTGFGTL